MSEGALVKKLGIKPNHRLLILNALEGYLEQLGPLPEGATCSTTADGSHFDFVQLFVKSRAELEQQSASVLGALKPGGLLWLCYPKQSAKLNTDIHRDTGWEAVTSAGFESVSLISVDDVWSAMRFRPTELVKRSSTSSRRTN